MLDGWTRRDFIAAALAGSYGAAALAAFETAVQPWDLLLTDVVMPGASGPDLVKQLVEVRPGLKVIYMSGYTNEAIVHHGVLDPGIGFLQKPFSYDALGRKLREALDRQQCARQPGEGQGYPAVASASKKG